MVTQKIKNIYENYFLGGYISNLIDNPDKSYISISMKSFNDESSKTIFIMVYRKAGYGDKKYPNPMAKIVKDAFKKHIPICCVYYNDNGKGNKMSCCYANFSVDKYAEVTDDGDLPF